MATDPTAATTVDDLAPEAPTDEHWPCVGECDHDQPWHRMFEALAEVIKEEADTVRALVRDPDSACPARSLRQQRLAALEWALAIADELRRWEW